MREWIFLKRLRVKVNTYQHFRLWRFCRKCKHTPIYWGFTGNKSIKAQKTNLKTAIKSKFYCIYSGSVIPAFKNEIEFFREFATVQKKNIFLFNSKWFTTKYHLIFTGSVIPKFLYIMYRSILIAFIPISCTVQQFKIIWFYPAFLTQKNFFKKFQ